MSRVLGAWLLAPVLLLAFPAHAQPSITMHRAGAGTLAASGWAQADSTSGAFTVQLPCLYNDFSAHGSPGDAVAATHTVGCQRPDGRQFTASRLVYRAGESLAAGYFRRFPLQPAWQGAQVASLSFQGSPAVDVAVSGPRLCGFMRMVQLGADENLLLVAEAPAAACAGLAQASQVFFESLRWVAR